MGKKRKASLELELPFKKFKSSNPSSVMSTSLKKTHLVRLMLQSLKSMNLHESAEMLEKESGIEMHDEAIEKWKKDLLDGKWESVMANYVEVLHLTDPKKQAKVQYLLLKQQFLELLHERKYDAALACLRSKISDLTTADDLHELACLMLCQNTTELHQRSYWKYENSRSNLLKLIHQCVPPTLIIPHNQLENLLLSAMEYKAKSHCLVYDEEDKEEGIPLLVHELLPQDAIPKVPLCILRDHEDEVWTLTFSPNGQYLATGGKDKIIFLYNCSDFSQPFQKFQGHTGAITKLEWSNDSTMLMSCAKEDSVKIWSIQTRKCLLTIKECLVGCWLPNNDFFIGNSQKIITRYSLTGQPIMHWDPDFSFHDITVSRDGTRMVLMGNTTKVKISYPDDIGLSFTISTDGYVQNGCLSNDGRFFLADQSKDGDIGNCALWDLESREVIQSFEGRAQTRYHLKSTFGAESFVIGGSEDCKIFVYDRETGKILHEIEHHVSAVTCTAYNSHKHLIASGSDDCTIRIYQREQ